MTVSVQKKTDGWYWLINDGYIETMSGPFDSEEAAWIAVVERGQDE